VTTRDLTKQERMIRAGVLSLNGGFCQLACTRQASNFAHRIPQGQGGPYIAANGLGLCGSGTTGCHWSTEQARDLAYACGWLVRTCDDVHPALQAAATPALITTILGRGWHILGDDGAFARLAEPGEVPDWMWPDGFDAAIRQLRKLARGSAA
jgi:hypothetical protein